MFDPEKVPAYLRTVIPALWGGLIAWLVLQLAWIPEDVHAFLTSDIVLQVVVGLVILVWYAVWRWLEPRLPAWFTRLVLGSNLTPTYGDPGDGGDSNSEPVVFDPEPVDWDNEVGSADITAATQDSE